VWLIILSSLIIGLLDGLVCGGLCAVFGWSKQEALVQNALGIILNCASIPLLLLVYMIIKKLNRNQNSLQIPNKNIILIIAGFISAIIYLFPIQTLALLVPDSTLQVPFVMIITLSGAIFIAILIVYIFNINKKEQYRLENEMYRHLINNQKEYY